MFQDMFTILSGIIFVIGVIAGIGPQNLNIISHAIKNNHSVAVTTTSCLADLVLLLIGVFGLSFNGSKPFLFLINIIGIVFVLWFLFLKIRGLFNHRNKFYIKNEHTTKVQAILKALALTWLNPLVIVDMLVIIAGAATHYHGVSWTCFVIGAVLGDIIWLYGLTFFARKFSGKLDRIEVWITLDLMTILIMLFILYKTIGFVM